MIKKCNKRISITMNKQSIDLIEKFAKALNLSVSQFVESVCCSHIISVVKKADRERKELQEKAKQKKGK